MLNGFSLTSYWVSPGPRSCSLGERSPVLWVSGDPPTPGPPSHHPHMSELVWECEWPWNAGRPAPGSPPSQGREPGHLSVNPLRAAGPAAPPLSSGLCSAGGYCSQPAEGPVTLAWLWCAVPTQTLPYPWAALSRSHHLSEPLLRCSHRALEARACACLFWVPVGSCGTFESHLQEIYVPAGLAHRPRCALPCSLLRPSSSVRPSWH